MNLTLWCEAASPDALALAWAHLRALEVEDFPGALDDLALVEDAIDRRNEDFPDACPTCFPDGFNLRYASVSEYHLEADCPLNERIEDPPAWIDLDAT